tara:strand:- start:563 stop:1027 length:465 start_codon:yes stop_codon:yes gene_type:complete
MFFRIKYHKYLFFLFIFIISIGCSFQEASKNHGIVFLENRSNKLKIDVSNTNDVIKIFGQPHSKSINNDNIWVYIERILVKGEYHKLGKHIVKENNILVLEFDNYGILKKKEIIDKSKKKNLVFSKKETKNELTQKSFVEKFLSSVRSKMYSNK